MNKLLFLLLLTSCMNGKYNINDCIVYGNKKARIKEIGLSYYKYCRLINNICFGNYIVRKKYIDNNSTRCKE